MRGGSFELGILESCSVRPGECSGDEGWGLSDWVPGLPGASGVCARARSTSAGPGVHSPLRFPLKGGLATEDVGRRATGPHSLCRWKVGRNSSRDRAAQRPGSPARLLAAGHWAAIQYFLKEDEGARG